MKKTNKIIIGIIIVALLLLGIGYALIQNITLTIGGTAEAGANQENFKVRFTGIPEVSDPDKVTAEIDRVNDIEASIYVGNLTAKDEYVTATYTVENASSDLSAVLSVETTNSNTDYFTLKAELAESKLKKRETTTLTVTVTLTKTPIEGDVEAEIGIQLDAAPVEPGKEGTGGSISSQTPDGVRTLVKVTNTNIGDYIDLGNNYVGTESTSDDWRVFSKDEYGVTVILSDYLPNSNYVQSVTKVSGTLNTFYNTDAGSMVRALSNTSYWTQYTNNISGAVAYGGPTLKELMTATEENLGVEFADDFESTGGEIQANALDNELYSMYFRTGGKMCLRDGDQADNKMWEVMNGSYMATIALGQDYLDAAKGVALRPIVWFPKDTEVINSNGVWEVVK